MSPSFKLSQISPVRFLLTAAVRLILHNLVQFHQMQVQLLLRSLVVVLAAAVTSVVQLYQLYVL